MKTKYIILLLFLMPCVLRAQRPLTLEECRAMALEKNKNIISANMGLEMADYTRKSYRANFFPKISATGMAYFSDSKMKYNLDLGSFHVFDPNDLVGVLPPEAIEAIRPLANIDLPSYDIDFTLNRTYMAGINLQQPIYMGGKIRSAYKMSSIGKNISGLNVKLTENEVIISTDEAYWTHFRALEMEKVALAYGNVVEGLLKDIEGAFDTGMSTRNDLYKVQVKFNEAELQVQKAANGVRLSRMNLCHMIGMPLTSDITISDELDNPTSVPSSPPDITMRPEYAILTGQIDLKFQEVRLTRSDFLPSLAASGGYNYLNGLRLNNKVLTDKASFSAMISLNIPIFNWGEGHYKVRAAKMEHSMAVVQRDEMAERMELELAMAMNQLREAALELTMTEKSLSQAEENLRISKDYYEVGMETLTGYLEAQTAWQQAWASMVDAKTAMKMNEVRYLKAGGLLNNTDLRGR